jgi:hypothetical protein
MNRVEERKAIDMKIYQVIKTLKKYQKMYFISYKYQTKKIYLNPIIQYKKKVVQKIISKVNKSFSNLK